MAIFAKCLSKTDVRKRLSVPSKSLKYFPLSGEHRAVDFKVKDENGRLEIGDKVEFCRDCEEGTGAGYRIKVKKVVRVFGAAFGHVTIGLPD
ncbi:hypothetical protein SLA2020_004470 [Shorea laevis]